MGLWRHRAGCNDARDRSRAARPRGHCVHHGRLRRFGSPGAGATVRIPTPCVARAAHARPGRTARFSQPLEQVGLPPSRLSSARARALPPAPCPRLRCRARARLPESAGCDRRPSPPARRRAVCACAKRDRATDRAPPDGEVDIRRGHRRSDRERSSACAGRFRGRAPAVGCLGRSSSRDSLHPESDRSR